MSGRGKDWALATTGPHTVAALRDLSKDAMIEIIGALVPLANGHADEPSDYVELAEVVVPVLRARGDRIPEKLRDPA